MLAAILMLAMWGDEKAEKPPAKAIAVAPSLKPVTREEEGRFDAIIDRFILADTGKLEGADAKKAAEAFDKLGPEAIPALIRGVNRAAEINHSCPVLMIAKKLSKMLLASDDEVLLEYARDEIGAGLTKASTHARLVEDLRFKVLMHKNAVARRPAKKPATMAVAELVRALRTRRGDALAGVVGELGKRDGDEAFAGLALAAAHADKEARKLARELLDARVGTGSMSRVKEYLEETSAEVRKSAVRVAIEKHTDLMPVVLDRLTDADPGVRAEAREQLRKLSKGKADFGPQATATREEQAEAKKRWKAWWEKNGADK